MMAENFDFFMMMFLAIVMLFFVSSAYLLYCYRTGNVRRVKLFVPVIMSLLFVTFSAQLVSRYYLFKFSVEAISQPSSIVKFNGIEVSNEIREKLIYAFKNRKQTKLSGSHPLEKITLTIQSELFSISFSLRKDSREHDLYWVFLRNSRITGVNTFINLNI